MVKPWGWHTLLVIALVAAGAFAVSGEPRALVAGALVGAIVVAIQAAMFYAWRRALPSPTVPPEATGAQRARLAQRYIARALVPIAVLSAAGIALAVVLPDDGPSVFGIGYFMLPVVLLGAAYAYLARAAR